MLTALAPTCHAVTCHAPPHSLRSKAASHRQCSSAAAACLGLLRWVVSHRLVLVDPCQPTTTCPLLHSSPSNAQGPFCQMLPSAPNICQNYFSPVTSRMPVLQIAGPCASGLPSSTARAIQQSRPSAMCRQSRRLCAATCYSAHRACCSISDHRLAYRADWEPAAPSGKCMAGVPGVLWSSPAVSWGPPTLNPTLVARKTRTSKNWPIFPLCMCKRGESAPCGKARL